MFIYIKLMYFSLFYFLKNNLIVYEIHEYIIYFSNKYIPNNFK